MCEGDLAPSHLGELLGSQVLAQIPVKIANVLLAKEPQGTLASVFDKPLLHTCSISDIRVVV